MKSAPAVEGQPARAVRSRPGRAARRSRGSPSGARPPSQSPRTASTMARRRPVSPRGTRVGQHEVDLVGAVRAAPRRCPRPRASTSSPPAGKVDHRGDRARRCPPGAPRLRDEARPDADRRDRRSARAPWRRAQRSAARVQASPRSVRSRSGRARRARRHRRCVGHRKSRSSGAHGSLATKASTRRARSAAAAARRHALVSRVVGVAAADARRRGWSPPRWRRPAGRGSGRGSTSGTVDMPTRSAPRRPAIADLGRRLEARPGEPGVDALVQGDAAASAAAA